MEPIRLNKYLSEAGVCSRREADRLIQSGKVLVDDQTAVMGMKVQKNQTIVCDGKLIGGSSESAQAEPVLLLVNKPRGIVCTTSKKDRAENIVDFLDYPVRIYPVGRLDKDSEGLLLMTNQGDLVNKIMRSGNAHEKEYLVTVNKPINQEFLKAMRNGVPILDTITNKCRVEATGTCSFRIILTQGLNRQIRRMCEHLGYQVRILKRVRIMNLCLGNLDTGAYRKVTKEEYNVLSDSLKGSTNKSYKESHYERKSPKNKRIGNGSFSGR